MRRGRAGTTLPMSVTERLPEEFRGRLILDARM